MDGIGKSHPIKAIQIIQNEDSHLNLAESEIFSEINGTNVAVNNSNGNCYASPTIGEDQDLVVGDLNTIKTSYRAYIGSDKS